MAASGERSQVSARPVGSVRAGLSSVRSVGGGHHPPPRHACLPPGPGPGYSSCWTVLAWGAWKAGLMASMYSWSTGFSSSVTLPLMAGTMRL